MKFIMGMIIGFTLGAVISLGAAKVWLHTSEPSYVPEEISYEQLFKYSSVAIEKDRFICESNITNTVGAVLAYIMKSNSNYLVNNLNEGCASGSCQISHTSCAPWQSDSCGSTTLSFSVEEGGAIDPNSFKCIQVP